MNIEFGAAPIRRTLIFLVGVALMALLVVAFRAMFTAEPEIELAALPASGRRVGSVTVGPETASAESFSPVAKKWLPEEIGLQPHAFAVAGQRVGPISDVDDGYLSIGRYLSLIRAEDAAVRNGLHEYLRAKLNLTEAGEGQPAGVESTARWGSGCSPIPHSGRQTC